jgi:hypothetical protein
MGINDELRTEISAITPQAIRDRSPTVQEVAHASAQRDLQGRLATLWLCRQSVHKRWDGCARPWASL